MQGINIVIREEDDDTKLPQVDIERHLQEDRQMVSYVGNGWGSSWVAPCVPAGQKPYMERLDMSF